jgi:hypothetical protein
LSKRETNDLSELSDDDMERRNTFIAGLEAISQIS